MSLNEKIIEKIQSYLLLKGSNETLFFQYQKGYPMQIFTKMKYNSMKSLLILYRLYIERNHFKEVSSVMYLNLLKVIIGDSLKFMSSCDIKGAF